MGISRRKAGAIVNCPKCGKQVKVPIPTAADQLAHADVNALIEEFPAGPVSESIEAEFDVEAVGSPTAESGCLLTTGTIIIIAIIVFLLVVLAFILGLLVGRLIMAS